MMNLMTQSQNHSQKHNPSQKRNKRRLTGDQLSLLESSFNANKKLEPERKQQLARELGIPPQQIAIWYQNRRARWKNQSLELDYSTLQLRLDATIAEKRQLQREVEWLRAELHNTQQTAAALQQAAAATHQYHQHQLSSCDDVGSSSLSLPEDVNCSVNHEQNEHHHHQVLQAEELYDLFDGYGSIPWPLCTQKTLLVEQLRTF